MCICLNVKHPLLPYFNETWLFSTDFSKNTQTSYFMKICPADFFQAKRKNRWTDRHNNANSRFLQFCTHPPKNAFKKWQHIQYFHTREDGLLEWIPPGMQKTERSWVTELKGMCVVRTKRTAKMKTEGEEWQIGTVRYKCITTVTYAP